jgi:hypothetical protein
LDILAEFSSILSLVAVAISVTIGIGTLRQRANEPNEKRWQEIYAWKAHIDENFTDDNENLWKEYRKWKENIDDRLDRDFYWINAFEKQFRRHGNFEYIMLSSMKGVLTHLSAGNHTQQMQEISRRIDEYLMNAKREDKFSVD